MTPFLRRLPSFTEILPVYAVAATPVFAWTITIWLWKLPSWLNYLTPGEVAGIFSYAMMTALIESLLILCLLLLLCLVLPLRSFRDQFVVRGTWLAVGLAVCVLGNGVWRGMTRYTYAEISLILWSLVGLIFIVALTFVSVKVRFMAQAAIWLSDRLTVFLLVFIPLSLLSLLVVIARNVISG